MSEEPKRVETKAEEGAELDVQEATDRLTEAADGESSEEQTEPVNIDDAASSTPAKKKKSKKKRVKRLSAGKDTSPVTGESSSESNNLPSAAMDSLLKNPSLQSEVQGMGKEKAEDMLRRLNMSELLTGMVRNISLMLH
jgi:hypothetical protein